MICPHGLNSGFTGKTRNARVEADKGPKGTKNKEPSRKSLGNGKASRLAALTSSSRPTASPEQQEPTKRKRRRNAIEEDIVQQPALKKRVAAKGDDTRFI